MGREYSAGDSPAPVGGGARYFSFTFCHAAWVWDKADEEREREGESDAAESARGPPVADTLAGGSRPAQEDSGEIAFLPAR
jgi:hypothetical protein